MSNTIIIQNPQSGTGDHVDAVQDRAELLGYTIKRTENAGDAILLTQEAAEAGFDTIVAAGGDGTVNEVVRGIYQAEAFADVTFGVVPVGTGNNFAEQLGITDLDAAFSVLKKSDHRRIDLGRANDRLFVNSCVAGLTANSSSETSADMKNRMGTLAYVITALRSISDFDSLPITIDSCKTKPGTRAWSGKALSVLVGNGRRFTTAGDSQANMEDGLFDVAVIKDADTLDLMSDRIVERLFGRDSAHIDRFQTSSLNITVHTPDTIRFSLDGEIIKYNELSLDVCPQTLTVAVGDTYDPNPDHV
ncbi:diacylglycerol/lipid kinase family protein [Halalkalirubrum salinum]|uniref:diacylglycerol/lipid kinase family protein n=1 Tax=Halalkalirubrum salinum TaxID=2563889 RepID=UPI0010FB2737|nr:diacylglycerol kinase family protein [Halalkalirubrum salinum]